MEIRRAQAADADAVFAMLERFAMSYEPRRAGAHYERMGFKCTAGYYHLRLS